MLHFGDVVDAVQHSRRDQPLNRLLKITGSAALPHSAVDKLLIGFGKLGDDAAEHHQDPPAVDLAIVLGEVIFIDLDQFSLNLGNFGWIFLLHPGGNALRHPANNQVVVVGFQQAVVKNLLYLLILMNAIVIGIERLVCSFQKLIKGQRIEVQQVDHAHRIGLRLGQQCPKQASCRNDMVFIGFLFEVFERIQRLGAFLDLVENDQRFLGENLFSGNQGEQFNNALGVLVGLENRLQFVFFIKVEVDKAAIAALPKLPHQPGLANLARTAHDQRLAVRAVFPVDQIRNRISLH